MILITQLSESAIMECESKMINAVLLFEETRNNHTADYPMHNRYFSNGDKPWVILINNKNTMKLNFDGNDYTIYENELVFFDDNIMHAWEMKNNDVKIYYYRAKSENPVMKGSYCLDEFFKKATTQT